MLDWQGKRWLKILSVVLIIAFITYDISWATDFSPISLSSITPGFIPKITNFISKNIFKKTQEKENLEETKISFRSQLVPTKKYEERSGFLRLESVKEMMKRQMDDMQKRRQIEEDRSNKYIINYNMNKGLYMNAVEKAIGEQSITDQVMKSKADTINAAAAGGEFSYVKYDDGMTVYMKDGLTSRIENEKIIDPLGNVTLKNSYNFKYNGKRLMTDYEADVIDPQQNIAHIKWSEATYTPDSEFYGTDETNANKLLTHYKMAVTDPLGNTTYTEWIAGAYEGKLLRDYHEQTIDLLGNVTYTDWSKIEYDDRKNVIKFHRETKEPLGYTVVTDRLESSYEQSACGGNDRLVHYTEVTSYLDVIKNTTWNGSYNQYDQLTSYNSVTTQNNGNMVSIEWSSVGNDGKAIYDNLNRLAGFTQKIHTKNNGEYLIDTIEETTQENIQYDRYNRIIGYKEISKNDKDNLTTTTIMTAQDTIYDTYHRYIGYILQTIIQDENNLLDIRRQVVRSDIGYDNFGRIISYKDTETNNIDNLKTTTVIDNIVYDLRGRQISFRTIATIEGESIYKKLTGLDTSKEGFTVNLAELTPQERWKLLRGESIKIIINDEEIIITPLFENMPVTVYVKTITIRENITYNSIDQVFSYSDTITTSGLSAGMVLEARNNFDDTANEIWEIVDRVFTDIENLQKAISETNDLDEKARLTTELEEAQENKDKLLEIALIVEDIYNNAGSLIEALQNKASEEIVDSIHKNLFEKIYSLGDKIDGMVIYIFYYQ
ncbi:MAG: hypothetical protein L6408_03270, partial [Nanoarchaeota archaeon]|nr:hypothetical protein [Nanoarchaeota archaeon]